MSVRKYNKKEQIIPKTDSHVQGFLVKNNILFKLGENDCEKEIGPTIRITQITTDIDTDKIVLQLEFDYKERTMQIPFARENLNRKGLRELVSLGANTFDFVANDYVKYLVGLEKLAPESNIHKTVGWGVYKGQKVFKHYHAIGDGCKSEYQGGQYDLKPRGSLDGWKKTINDYIVGHKWLEIILAIGFTAPLIGLFGKRTYVDSLFFHLYGLSSSGKTTATRVAVSPWGLPDTSGNGLIKTWNGSDVNILSKFRGNFGIPIALDDASVRSSSSDFTSLIYQLAMGRDKDRLDQDANPVKTAEWSTTILSNAEHSLLENSNKNGGLRVRLIEIGNQKLTASSEHSEAITKGLLENCGYAGPLFVKYLLGLGEDDLYRKWEHWENELKKANLKKDDYSDRIAKKLAIVMLAAELANKSLDLHLNTTKILDSLLELESTSYKERNVAENAYDFLIQLFFINKNKFSCDDPKILKPFGDCWGKYDTSDGKATTIYILKKIFQDEMKKAGFSNYRAIMKLWKDQKLLRTSTDRNTKDKVIDGQNSVVYEIVVDPERLK